MTMRGAKADAAEHRLTGRAVLFMLLGFFGFVTLVNVVMVGAAVSTFGGVDTPSSYQAGLAFAAEEEAAAAQNARQWAVIAEVTSVGSGAKVVTIEVRDKAGAPITNAELGARLVHPIDARRDVTVAMHEIGPGIYSGTATAGAGQWRLDIDVARNGARLFRSRNRLVLR